MDFLKYIAFPQSSEHITLLHTVLVMVSILFVPYVSALLGGSLVSVFFHARGTKTKNLMQLRFAKDITDVIIVNKSVLFFQGAIPYLSIVFAYSQLLQESAAISVGIMMSGFFFFLIGIILLYAYHYTFKVGTILENVSSSLVSSKKETVGQELSDYRHSNDTVLRRSGIYGLVCIVISAYLLIGGITLAVNPAGWETTTSVLQMIFSFDVLVRFGQFLAGSLALTGVAILFFFFSWQGGILGEKDGEYSEFVQKTALNLSIVTTLLLPVLILLSILLLPPAALSSSVFGFAVLSIVALLFCSQLLYGMSKKCTPRLSSNTFFVLLIAFVFVILKDESSFENATQQHSAVLALHYQIGHEALLASFGIGAKPLTGEEIFSGRCSACHMFADKKIGPAYKDVLPKYENNREKLLAFILNPVKMNPAFPPMPNQGLRPAEADSIASYILRMYKK